MGVVGLWDLLSPAARRVPPEALKGQVLAVDTSIWLVQFLKAMRDESGNMVRGAHIIGCFRRICKLLYYGVRPIFVFDGPPPPLKLKTLLQRRQLQQQQNLGLKRTAEKLLLNQLKLRAITHARGRKRRAQRSTTSVAEECSQPSQNGHVSTEVISPTPDVFESKRSTPAASSPQVISDDAAGVNLSKSSSKASVSTHEKDAEEPSATIDGSLFSDTLDETDEALSNAAFRRARRVAYYSSIPQEFAGFLAGRRRLDDIQVNASGLENILSMPTLTRSKRPFDVESNNSSLSRLFIEEEEFKEYCVTNENGEQTFIPLPLDSSIDPEVFAHLPSKLQYSILHQIRDAWLNESRFRAIQAKDDPETFSNIQVESFLRHVNTTKEITKAKKAMADQIHAAISSSASGPTAAAERNSGSMIGNMTPLTPVLNPKNEDCADGEEKSPRMLPALQLPPSGVVKPIAQEDAECGHLQVNGCEKKSRHGGQGKMFQATLRRQLAVKELQPLPPLEGVKLLTQEFKLGTSGWATLKGDPCLAWKEMRKTLQILSTQAECRGAEQHHRETNSLNDIATPDMRSATVLTATGQLSGGKFSSEEDDTLYTNLSPTDLFENLSITPQILKKKIREKPGCSALPTKDPNDIKSHQDVYNDNLNSSTPYGATIPSFSTKRIKLKRKSSSIKPKALPTAAVTVSASSADSGSVTTVAEGGADTTDLEMDEWGVWEAAVSSAPKATRNDETSSRVGSSSTFARSTVDQNFASASCPANVRQVSLAGDVEGLQNYEHSASSASAENFARKLPETNGFKSLELFSEEAISHKAPRAPVNSEKDVCGASPISEVNVKKLNLCQENFLLTTEAVPLQTVEASSKTAEVEPKETAEEEFVEITKIKPLETIEVKPMKTAEAKSVETTELKPLKATEIKLPKTIQEKPLEIINVKLSEPMEGRPSEATEEKFPKTDEGEPSETTEVTFSKTAETDFIKTTKEDLLTKAEKKGLDLESVGLDAPKEVLESSDATPMLSPEKSLASVFTSPTFSVFDDNRNAAGWPDSTLLEVPLMSLDAEAEALNSERSLLEAELLMYKRDADEVTPEMQADVKHLLALFGVPYLEAPAEAEAQCAVLTELGFCEGVISDDSDSLVFGAKNVYRHFFETRSSVELYDLRHIETHFKLSKQDLILIAMLLGCDYTPGVSGIGIVNAVEAIKVFPGLQGLAKLRDWATDPARVKSAGVREDDTPARKRYKETHKGYRSQWVFPDLFPSQEVWDAFDSPVVDRSAEPFSWGSPSTEDIVEWLQRTTGMTEETIFGTLRPVLNQRLKSKAPHTRQAKITSYFTPILDDERVAQIRSKRLRHLFPQNSSAMNPSPPTADVSEATVQSASSVVTSPERSAVSHTPNRNRASLSRSSHKVRASTSSRNAWERLAAVARDDDRPKEGH